MLLVFFFYCFYSIKKFFSYPPGEAGSVWDEWGASFHEVSCIGRVAVDVTTPPWWWLKLEMMVWSEGKQVARRGLRDFSFFFQQITEERDDLGGKGKEKVRAEKKEREKKGAFPGMTLMTPYFSLSSYCSVFVYFFGYFLVSFSLIWMWVASHWCIFGWGLSYQYALILLVHVLFIKLRLSLTSEITIPIFFNPPYPLSLSFNTR